MLRPASLASLFLLVLRLLRLELLLPLASQELLLLLPFHLHSLLPSPLRAPLLLLLLASPGVSFLASASSSSGSP